MRPVAPANLVQRLERLHLATPAQVAAVSARVRKLSGELLEFESVWIDALAQAKTITPWQAAELNAGRGDQLACGNYVLTSRLETGFAECYLATHVDSKDVVRLYICQWPQRPAGETLVELQDLAARNLSVEGLAPVFDCGTNGKSVWAACRAIDGLPSSHWLAENGRLPPAGVLQIARAMTEQLVALERQRLVHGDISAAGLLIDRSGNVWMPAPGLRGIARPQEGVGFPELRPEAYDYLAPERVANGAPPDTRSDLYACGALWWHLLAGRPPIAGGNSRAKLYAIQAARVVDVRSIAQSVPSTLADAIASCLARNPDDRPTSFSELAEMLGAATDAGRELLASLQRSPGTWQNLRSLPARRPRRRPMRPIAIGAACAVAVFAVTALPLLFRSSPAGPGPTVSVEAPTDSVEALPPGQLPAAKVASAIVPASQTLPHESNEMKVDPDVRPATAVLPSDSTTEMQRVVEDLVLPTGEVLQLSELELEPRMRVRGRGGRRPLVSVPVAGLLVDCENVVFEGIDFVWQTPVRDDQATVATRAIIRLQAQTVHFRGCSFNARNGAPPAAIRTLPSRQKLGGFGVELVLSDCVFDGVNSIVGHESPEAISARLDNCLCVASGPILRLARCPAEDVKVQLQLEHVTTRGDTSVMLIQNARGLSKPGPVSITASGCVLAGTSRTGLISLIESPNPSALIEVISWNGQGSVMSPRAPMLTSQSAAGETTPLADDQLSVAGLVRGELEFAGRADGPPSDSSVMRWQAPLRSAEPPGVDADRLHSLRSKRDE